MTTALLSAYQENRRGIIALTAACGLYTVNDTLTKLTTLFYAPSEVLFLRGTVSAVCLGAVVLYLRQYSLISAAVKPLVLLRAGLDALANVAFILALNHMRLADLMAVNLVAPLLVIMFMAIFFKEPVGWRRWCAILFGLAGTLFIVKPSPTAFNAWALLAVATATASALRDVTTRQIHLAVPTAVVSLVTLVAVALSGLAMALFSDERWTPLASRYVLYIGGAAFVVGVATLLAVAAFRNVDVSVVAPFRYSFIVFGGLAGYLVFGEIPDIWSGVGASMIVCSGLYSLHRERLRHRELSAKVAIH